VGDAEIVKAGAAAIVRFSDAVLLRLPEVPVMVTVAVPNAAEARAVSVSVVAALKDAITPAGKPDAARATAPLKPFSGVTVMAPAAVAP